MTFLLPGGTRLKVQSKEAHLIDEVDLTKEENRIYIRNHGSADVNLSGHLITEELQTITAGQRITIPLYDADLKDIAEPIVIREIEGMIVKTTGGYSFEEFPGHIRVFRPTTKDGVACIGGVRVFLKPGESIVLNLK